MQKEKSENILCNQALDIVGEFLTDFNCTNTNQIFNSEAFYKNQINSNLEDKENLRSTNNTKKVDLQTVFEEINNRLTSKNQSDPSIVTPVLHTYKAFLSLTLIDLIKLI